MSHSSTVHRHHHPHRLTSSSTNNHILDNDGDIAFAKSISKIGLVAAITFAALFFVFRSWLSFFILTPLAYVGYEVYRMAHNLVEIETNPEVHDRIHNADQAIEELTRGTLIARFLVPQMERRYQERQQQRAANAAGQ